MRQALAVSAEILTQGALGLEELSWGTLRFQHTAALQAALRQRYTAAGASKILSAVRGVLRAAWQLEQMTAEDFHAAAAVKSVKGSQEEPVGRALASGEILALLDACLADPTPAGYRDAAVIGPRSPPTLAGPRSSAIDLSAGRSRCASAPRPGRCHSPGCCKASAPPRARHGNPYDKGHGNRLAATLESGSVRPYPSKPVFQLIAAGPGLDRQESHMSTFVALLRGVNVGKAKRVPMAELRALLVGLGYTGVVTLLNSGNAVFQAAGGAPAQHAAAIAAALAVQLNVEVPVIVKSAAELAAIVAQNPIPVAAADPARCLVAFVQEPTALPGLAAIAPLVLPPEQFALGAQAAYLLCAAGILESKAGEALLGKAGRAATTRNWATVLKLHALAGEE